MPLNSILLECDSTQLAENLGFRCELANFVYGIVIARVDLNVQYVFKRARFHMHVNHVLWSSLE